MGGRERPVIGKERNLLEMVVIMVKLDGKLSECPLGVPFLYGSRSETFRTLENVHATNSTHPSALQDFGGGGGGEVVLMARTYGNKHLG